ncbi:MAG: DUF1653 domain-containing protein [Patescibacteria group bacterium]
MHDIYNDTPAPEHVPEPGFYYHYKHDPLGPENNYAYEVVAVGHHTEEDARPEDRFMVAYRPLYDTALVYRLGRMFDLRPLDMFMETVVKDGIEMPRFDKIDDMELISRLKIICAEMYPQKDC